MVRCSTKVSEGIWSFVATTSCNGFILRPIATTELLLLTETYAKASRTAAVRSWSATSGPLVRLAGMEGQSLDRTGITYERSSRKRHYRVGVHFVGVHFVLSEFLSSESTSSESTSSGSTSEQKLVANADVRQMARQGGRQTCAKCASRATFFSMMINVSCDYLVLVVSHRVKQYIT